jgi:chromosome segregation ATPase
MTDKQIIIDGVDVSGCKYYLFREQQPNGERCCGMGLVDCNGNDCLYKKYKRKEQECEKLETARHLIEISRDKWEYRAKSKERECESLNRWLPIISRLENAFGNYEKAKAIDYKSYIEQIFAELDQLKKQHQADKGLITSTGKMNYQLIQEYDKLKTENNNIKETFDGLFKVQYKLADNNKKLRQCLTEIKEIVGIGLVDGLQPEEYNGFLKILQAQILQKISEVNNDMENN